LRDITVKYGGEYYASAVGEVNVVQLMKEERAVIGGEGNGGVIYPELHYGRDAMVGIALFLTHLAKSNKKTSELRATYPNYFIAKKKMELISSANIEMIFDEIEKKYEQYDIDTQDGLKISFEKDWVHLRRSNTEPIIRIYAESQSEEQANELADKLISDLKFFTNSKNA
jgi:phosphomannomutase